jgi:hydrogenase maturation factor
LWLLDLASHVHSTTRLDGFDINLSQGPHPKWLPPAVSVSKLDLFQDPPEELVGVYDIVHVSLVVCFVDDSQIKDIVRRLVTLLSMTDYDTTSRLRD